MKHAASQELYAYWEERRGKRSAPERAEIEPGAIRQALSDAFILALDDRAGYPFRLAGTRVCALFGRELKGEPSSDFGPRQASRSSPISLASSNDERVGTVAGVTAHNGNGEPIEIELLLLPLSAPPSKPRPHHRHSGAAESSAMAWCEPDRHADAWAAAGTSGQRSKPVCCRVLWRRAGVTSSSTKAAASRMQPSPDTPLLVNGG